MNIGLTYDLRDDYLARGYSLEETGEFDSVATIEGIEKALASLGFTTERIGNIEQLVTALAAGKRWELVFNIAEGLHGRGREAQVPALLDAYRIPYTFSDPLVLALTLDKALTKTVLRAQGIPTADFALIEHEAQIANITLAHPLFAKPVAEGTGKGISNASLINDAKQLHETCRNLLEKFRQPVLVETYLPGREFTVGITGTGAGAEVIAVMEIIFGEKADACGYTFDNKQYYEDRISYRLADDAEARNAANVALNAWRALGCRDGGRIDLRSDAKGQPHFLEVNPLAGLNYVTGDLVILSKLAGLSYEALLGRIMSSALERSGLQVPQALRKAS